MLSLTELWNARGRYADVINRIEPQLDRLLWLGNNSRDLELLGTLSVAQGAVGDATAAIATLERLVRLQPANLVAIDNLVQLYAGRQDFPAAARWAREGLVQVPDGEVKSESRRQRFQHYIDQFSARSPAVAPE